MSINEQECPVRHRSTEQSQPDARSRSPHRNVNELDPHDLDMTAFWSSARVRARDSIVQIDTDMQAGVAAAALTGREPRRVATPVES